MKKLTLLFSILLASFYCSQTTLTTYQFENIYTPDETPASIGNPNLTLTSPADFTYTTGQSGSALATITLKQSTRGGYIKLTINTSGYSGIKLSFDGFGSGTGVNTKWEIFANKNGGAPSFSTSASDYVSGLAVGNTSWTTFNRNLSTTANTNFDNTNLITVFIVPYNYNTTGNNDRILRIDNLKILGTAIPPCSVPAQQPTALNFSNVSSSQINGSFTATNPASTGYLVVRSSSNLLSANPVNGTVYSAGTALGGGVVVSSGSANIFSDNALIGNSQYYYFVFAYNSGTCMGGPVYRTESPLQAQQITCPSNPTGNSVSDISDSGAVVRWVAPAGGTAGVINYAVEVTTDAGFSSPVGGSPFTGTVLSRNLTGLNSGTTYYYRIHANNGCSDTPGISGSFTTLLAPCAASPSAGTTQLSPSTGIPSSVFTASVSGDAQATGLSYQWQVAESSTGPFTDIFGATQATPNLTALSTPGTRYYRRKITCAASGLSSYSSVVSYSTKYCPSTVTLGVAATNYIKMVKFIGTLQDTSQSSTYSSSPSGYQDYTANAVKSVQAQGNGINLYAENNSLGMIRAWVDWNRDGIFDNINEQVYTSGGTSIVSTTFGFVIPTATIPGNYTIRLRMNSSGGSNNYSPCGNLDNPGETEDYLFTVISNCSATITGVTDGIRFGAGSVPLMVATSGPSTEVRWYDSLTAGTLVATTPVSAGVSTWAPNVDTTKIYYVASWNGSCESLVRIPVKATVRPIPVITFTPETPTTCGSNSTTKISAEGQNETNYLIEEDFENGLGEFTSRNLVLNGSTIDPKTQWKIQTSTYTPRDQVWFPAIASGTSGNRFVMATSDVGNYSVDNELVSPERNTADYSTLLLSFRMYYSKYSNDEVADASDYVAIEVNQDGGTVWTLVDKIIKDVGYGTEFALKTIDMSSYKSSKFRFRIRYYGKYKDGVAVDDVELYGVKPLTTSFAWTTSAPINTFTDAAATIPYIEGAEVTTVYMNPSLEQKETTASWTINATASLTNGSIATGTVTIENKNKVWNVPGNQWSDSSWRPIDLVPTLTDCVYIRTPVAVSPGISGFAKELYVVSGGKLTISNDASLTVKDAFANYAGTDDVVIESNGGLVQINNSPTINTGNITAKRTLNLSAGRQQYNFVASPLEGQSLRTIYSGIDYVLYHNEANNFFYSSSGAYIKGRGLAVKEPNSTSASMGDSTVSALFKGYPTNGAFSYGIVNTNLSQARRGFNLIGNPYPSNIDLMAFYALNGGTLGALSSTFYLWDNRANSQTVQRGDLYEGQAYAQFNAEHGTGTMATGDVDLAGNNLPNSIIKMGQAFMVKTSVSSQQLNFNNTIRTAENSTVSFFGKARKSTGNPVDRYWLNLMTPGNTASNIAIVYLDGGTKAFSKDDSFSMGGSDVVYSWAGTEKVSINGRSSFTEDDVIPLGTVHFVSGKYTFALQKKEGIFTAGQNIYLKDKHAGVITNLSKGNYSFDATKGESTGRFEIIYRPETILATGETVKEEIQVYRDENNFVVKAQTRKITALELYDASGRMLHQSAPNSIDALVNSESLNNGVYLLKIIQNDVVSIKKIIR